MPIGGRDRRRLIDGRERTVIQHKSRRCATCRPVGSLSIMRRIAKWSVVPVLVVLLGVAGAGQAGAHNGATTVCGSSRGHLVIARDVQAEVYRVRKGESAVYEYWGCVYGSRKTFLLGEALVSGSPYGSLWVAHVTLAGTTVAYETSSSSSPGGVSESPTSEELDKSAWHIVVAELRARRILHKVPTGVTYPPNPNFVGDGPVTAIEVKSDGAIAWILDTVQPKNRYQVHALDATGERILAVGSNIAPNSLALAGSTLYWMQGGKPFSASLS